MISWSSFEATDGEYELAHKWLLEAQRYSKSNDGGDIMSEEEVQWVRKNLDALQIFQTAREVASTDRSQADALCKQIIKNHNKSDLLQLGDSYALLIQIQTHSNGALKLIKEMEKLGLSPSEYIESDAIEKIKDSVEVDLSE